MTKKPESNTDWSAATWKGSRLQQHREFHALPLTRKLELIEEMSEFASALGATQKANEPSLAAHDTRVAYPLRQEPESDKPPCPGDSAK